MEGLYVWDAFSWKKLFTISDSEGDPNMAAWSPDGRRIATHTIEGIGAIWDAQTGEKLLDFRGHLGEVWGLDWAPSAERLATGGYDGAVRVWDAHSCKEVLHYSIGSIIHNLDWSPDGSKLLIAYADKISVLPVWNTTQELIDYAKACCVVRELSPEDRELYGLPPVQE